MDQRITSYVDLPGPLEGLAAQTPTSIAKSSICLDTTHLFLLKSRLNDCKTCVHLSTIEHAPMLKYLKIIEAIEGTKIGSGF